MLNSTEIKAQIAEGDDRIKAILAVAEEEDRELTPEEQQEYDTFHGVGDEPGEFGKLEVKLVQAEKVEARQKKIALERLSPKLEEQIEKIEGSGGQKIVIPAKAKRHGKLKAFRGEDAQRDAYISGHAFAAHLYGNEASKEWLDNHGISAAMSESDNSKGGIFVPVETETAIIRLVEEYGVFRSGASPEPMGSSHKVVPVRTSGLTAHPVAETNSGNQGSNPGTESDAKYKNIELVARKWKVVTRMSDELNEDALISMGDQLTQEAALAFATAEDQAGFLGDGTSTYHGIKGLASVLKSGAKHTAQTGNTSFGALDFKDFEDMMGKLPDYPGIMPAWHITKEGYWASMGRLLNAAGGNTNTNIENGPALRFLGLPVVLNQVTNKTLTTQTNTRLLYLGDLNMSAKFGDRRGVTMSLTNERYWDEDQIGIKWTERFDINIHSAGTASDPGAIIGLDTPGS